MKKYVCEPCGYEYDPEVGDPENGIAPGTSFEELPEDWVCPICGMGKDESRKGCRIPRRPFCLFSRQLIVLPAAVLSLPHRCSCSRSLSGGEWIRSGIYPCGRQRRNSGSILCEDR